MLAKRIFDFSFSAIGLIFLAPLLLAIGILIRIHMPGPIFFRQLRAGKNGIPFSICKFRTMTVNHNGNSISVKGENRITPFGATLRKYKLDELPELWNILVGDMSFVGPRPDMPEYINKLAAEDRKILELRPGLTGPASIKYAREEELLASVTDPQKYNDEIIWPDKIRINLDYYYNRNFLGDIKIITRTIFGRKGSVNS